MHDRVGIRSGWRFWWLAPTPPRASARAAEHSPASLAICAQGATIVRLNGCFVDRRATARELASRGSRRTGWGGRPAIGRGRRGAGPPRRSEEGNGTRTGTGTEVNQVTDPRKLGNGTRTERERELVPEPFQERGRERGTLTMTDHRSLFCAGTGTGRGGGSKFLQQPPV